MANMERIYDENKKDIERLRESSSKVWELSFDNIYMGTAFFDSAESAYKFAKAYIVKNANEKHVKKFLEEWENSYRKNKNSFGLGHYFGVNAFNLFTMEKDGNENNNFDFEPESELDSMYEYMEGIDKLKIKSKVWVLRFNDLPMSGVFDSPEAAYTYAKAYIIKYIEEENIAHFLESLKRQYVSDKKVFGIRNLFSVLFFDVFTMEKDEKSDNFDSE